MGNSTTTDNWIGKSRNYTSWPIYVIGLLYLSFSMWAFTYGLREGYIYLKVVILACVSLLIFFPKLYPFLFGLLIPTYFELKPYSDASYDKNFMVPFSCVMIIIMFIAIALRKVATKDCSFSLFDADIPSICLLSFVIIPVIWFPFSENEFLAFRQIIKIMAFSAAYFIGKASNKDVIHSCGLLLIGLFLGLFAFTLPWSLGTVLHGGTKMLKTLAYTRDQLGAVSVAVESGMTLIIFGFAYAFNSSKLPPRLRRLSLWLVAIPACLATLVYLSRAAILLMPICILITLFIAGHKKAAIFGVFVFFLIMLLVFLLIPELVGGIENRLSHFSGASKTRYSIRLIALKVGLAHPIIGVGPGQFRFHSGGIWHAHNDALSIFSEQGFISLSFYFLFLLYSAVVTLKLYMQKKLLQKSIGGILIVVIVAYLGYSQIEPLYNNPGGLLFSFLIGIGTSIGLKHDANVPET